MRIGVAGVTGRMGRLVAEEVVAAGAILSGGVSRAPASEAAALARASAAFVDFTHGDTTIAHAEAVRQGSCAWILGTTGITPDGEAAIERAARAVPVVWAANFSPAVTVLLDVARRLARALPAAEYDAEIMEMHHRHKRDAPSGTALAFGEAVATGRGVAFGEARLRARDGQTGGRPAGGIGFAALRGGEVVGEHTVLFAGVDDHIAVTHTALDRRVFARGAVRAALWTEGRAPGLYSMADVLGLSDEGLSAKGSGR